MARYKVILAYDGTDFFGMQRQAQARTVQGAFEDALRKIGWQGRSILAAGRTDAGVHASGQVAAFDLDWSHSEDELLKAINANLPADAAVQRVSRTSADFHPRFDALSRRYRYRIYCRSDRDPLLDRHAWRVWPEPDVDHMQAAAQRFVGEHDFSAFGTPPDEGGPTIRNVIAAGWHQKEDLLSFEIEANAFLYHMVRRIVQFLVQVGQGKSAVDELETLLSGQVSEMVRGLAPAKGLELVEVRFVE